jgi:hypothetical protein
MGIAVRLRGRMGQRIARAAVLGAVLLFGSACSEKSDPFAILSDEQLLARPLYCRTLEGIPPTFFEQSGSTTFHKSAFERRNYYLPELWRQDGGYFLVEGHVDRQEASTGQGDRLSRARAEVVAQAIEELGIPKEYIFAVGRSDAYPRVVRLPGITSQLGNRRVEINPSHWGRRCAEDLLIRLTIVLYTQCRREANPDAATAARCETELHHMPAIHRHFFR